MTDKWAVRHFELAQHAARWSKDPRTKVGAVLVSGSDSREMAIGYNGFPKGLRDLPERYAEPKTKYLYTQHAERNVLDNARFSCVNATLVTTMFPCVECAKSMISKGVTRLVTPHPPEPITEPSWRDDCVHSLSMLREARVRLSWVEVCGTREHFIIEDDGVFQLGG